MATLRGRPLKTFTFTGLGKLGRRSAVAEIFGLRLKGLFAWLLWRGVYVTKFPGLSGQIRLLADWVLDAVLPRDINQLRLFHKEPVHREHFEPDERVFGAGDVGDKVYFIAAGEATVRTDGRVLAELKAGDVFGEAALLSDQPRNAEVHARTALDVVVVSRDAFHELLGHVPGVRASMQRISMSRSAANAGVEKESATPV